MKKETKGRLDKMKKQTAQKFGPLYVNYGADHYRLDVVPTPSLMLDYKTGIGGFPYGHGVEVYGANHIGKSSAVAYGVLANVVKQDRLGVLIASEPRLATPEDRQWAMKLGLDPDEILIQYPDTVQQAFEMLRELTFGEDHPDYIVIDSMGGMGNASSAQEGGKDKAFGISGAITAGLNDLMPRLYKNNTGLLILNQQRQAPSPKPGMIVFESPGGQALKHHMRMRIHIKPGGDRHMARVDGDSIMVGQSLACVFRKNNMSQSQEKTAKFDFYFIETDERGVGVDKAQDIINVGKMTGVIQGGSWLEHHTFPGNGKLNGKKAVGEYLESNPDAYEVIRKEVMSKMIEREVRDGEANREKAQKAQVKTEENGEARE